jgi:hypothetical protein
MTKSIIKKEFQINNDSIIIDIQNIKKDFFKTLRRISKMLKP